MNGSYIIIGLVVILVILVRVALQINQSVPRSSPGLFLVLLLVLLAGVVLFSTSYRQFRAAQAQQHQWPAVGGVVERSEIDRRHDAYRPLIIYSYSVEGRSYIDSSFGDAPQFGGKRKRYEVAEAIVKAYPSGHPIRVHYNPADPGESTLVAHVAWDIYMRLGFAVLLLAIGFFGVLLPQRSSSESAQSREVSIDD